MAEVAGAPFQDAPYVLLISDRPAERQALQRGIGAVLPCHALGSAQLLPARPPVVAVIDLDVAADAAGLLARCAEAPCIPCLVIARAGEPAMPPAPHRRAVPVEAPRTDILAAVFALVETATRAAERTARRLRMHGAAAMSAVAAAFGDAASGGSPREAAATRGTEIVLDAVSEAGIAAWLAVVWQHEMGLYQHTLSVAGFAAAFGSRLGLRPSDHLRVARAALLHDIGKTRIPTAILNKPGRLDAAEAALMRRHPALGADLLAEAGGFDAEVIDVVRHHHERLDGSGYPDGLSGAAVSDMVRLVAVCDVFSALTERRSYRAPMPAAQAFATMVEARGHLDPALLQAFAPIVLRVGEPTGWFGAPA